MGMAPTKIMFVVILSFEASLVSSPILFFTKKLTNKYKKICNFTTDRDHSYTM